MASWEDGPEYAPTERPDAFVAPDAVPLVPAAAPTPSAVAVADAPAPAYQPPATGVPLDAVEPPRPPQRDPLAAFDVAATPLTTARPSTPASATDFAPPVGLPVLPAVNAWDATYSAHTGPRPKPVWAPEQPFQPPQAPPMSLPAPQPTWGPAQVNPASFPPPQTPGWYPPPSPGLPGPGPLPPVTLGQMWSAATTGVMVSLLVGGLMEVQRIAGPDDLAGLTAVFYSLSYVGFFVPAVLAARTLVLWRPTWLQRYPRLAWASWAATCPPALGRWWNAGRKPPSVVGIRTR